MSDDLPAAPSTPAFLQYGPDIYAVTGLGIRINIICALWLENADCTEGSSEKVCMCHFCRRPVSLKDNHSSFESQL